MIGLSDPQIVVNGQTRPLGGVPVHTNALDFLRGLGLTGAKEGCAEGECGACAVMVCRPAGSGSRWTSINSCLVPAAALDGQEVVTAEGLGSPDHLHPVQAEMAARGGSQCGYCTPGFICSMAAEFYRPTEVEFEVESMSGNLCRCTGYRPIRDAALALGAPADDDALAERQTRPAPGPGSNRPVDLAAALGLLRDHPDATVVAGSTDHGVEVNLRGRRSPYVVYVDRLPELRTLSVAGVIEIGAGLTLSEAEAGLGGAVPLLDRVWPLFASPLIRNGATIGGNLGTASPIGDLPPALLALDATVVIAGIDGEREVELKDHFTGYRETALGRGELIRAVRIPTPLAGLTGFHKIAKRRADDISSVAVGFALDIEDGVVRTARIGVGGVAATPIRALATEAALEGRPWTEETVDAAAEVMRGEGTPLDDHRASAAYRSAMLGTALRKLWSEEVR